MPVTFSFASLAGQNPGGLRLRVNGENGRLPELRAPSPPGAVVAIGTATCRKIRQFGVPVVAGTDRWPNGRRNGIILGMTATLRPEQVAELERSGGSPLVVENPRTRQGYVLVPREAYQHAQLLEETLQQRAINATGRV